MLPQSFKQSDGGASQRDSGVPKVFLSPRPPSSGQCSSRPFRQHLTVPEECDEEPRCVPDDNAILEFFNAYMRGANGAERRRTQAAPSLNTRNDNEKCVRSGECAAETEMQRRLSVLLRTPVNESPHAGTGEAMLPERRPGVKFTVVLDLDQTLVHATQQERPCDFCINVIYEGAPYRYYVSVRPYAKELCEYLRSHPEFEVVIFTAAKEPYGRAIVEKLDPSGSLGRHFFASAYTSLWNKRRVKDLARLGRELDTTVMLDDSPDTYLLQRRSSFPISPWRYQMADDTELLFFIETLETIRNTTTTIRALDEYKARYLTPEAFNRVVGDDAVGVV